MAKIKNTKAVSESVDALETVEVVETESVSVVEEAPAVEETTKEPQLDINAIYEMMAGFQRTINELQAQLEVEKQKNAAAPVVQTVSDGGTEKLIELLGNKKSDREVTIIHNRELLGGLSTSIRLTGISIDFHTLGEERVLSWQQFEECVSKYRRWFDKEIILLSSEHAELSERYNVPCLKRAGKNSITKGDLLNLYRMDERKLEDYVTSLTTEDQNFVCSYWLGKCYQGDDKYLNRSKIELLNRISHKGVFDTLLTAMNFDSVKN